ncbi:MAG: class I SAM-dependent methyltransferase [Acidobacteria bacterium]|nr:class I SAM-dependent methyltransferase [Acidobacteriota bacterium]
MESEREHRNCPACHGQDARHIGAKGGFEIFVCRSCSSIFTDRVPENDEQEDYDGYYSEANLSVPPFIRTRLREIIGGFESYRKTNRILDIGFGAGTLLETALELGWEVWGLEVSKPAVDQALAKGLNVFHGSIQESDYQMHFFDVVTASEILEHLPEPEADLKEIVRILRPGGLFWGTTPSARSISFRLLGLDWSVLSPPEHIQLYSRDGAKLMLRNAGFGEIRFKTYGVNPAEIKNHYSKRGGDKNEFSRVCSAYELNQSLTQSRARRLVKDVLNEVLNISHFGDSLKIFAETK